MPRKNITVSYCVTAELRDAMASACGRHRAIHPEKTKSAFYRQVLWAGLEALGAISLTERQRALNTLQADYFGRLAEIDEHFPTDRGPIDTPAGGFGADTSSEDAEEADAPSDGVREIP